MYVHGPILNSLFGLFHKLVSHKELLLLTLTHTHTNTKMGQTLSSTNFFFYGKKHFTHKGYLRHIKDYNAPVQTSALALDGVKDGINLDGRVVVITGANSGLGKEVATYSAAKGAKVYMLCRTKKKAEAAREEIIKATGNDKVEIVLVDVSELEQIRNAAKEIQSKEQKVHALVCNAGVLVKEKKLTKEGYEATFASHLLGGSYLLSKLLIPQVEADEEGRIIFITSGKSMMNLFSSRCSQVCSLFIFPFFILTCSLRRWNV